jgi:hypothetical protein
MIKNSRFNNPGCSFYSAITSSMRYGYSLHISVTILHALPFGAMVMEFQMVLERSKSRQL